MKHFKKLFFALFCLAFISCSSDQKAGVTEVKVTFWGSPEEIEIITNSISDWQAEHPQIKVIFEHTPYAGYDSKILTRIAGGAAPDIIATEVDYFVTFATKGTLEDLTPYFKNDPSGFSKEEFFDSIVDRFTYQNQFLALPRDVAPFACVFYNKKLFDEAKIPYPTNDWTMDDLLRISRELTKKDETGRITQYGFYTWAWKNFIYGFGGALVDDVKNPTKTLLTDPKSIEGMQFYSNLINVYGVMPTPVALTNLGMGIDRLFAKGQLAMFGSGIWETPGLRNYDFDWDVVMFPKGKDGKRAFGTGGSGYAMLKSSKNKAAAWEVLKALTGVKGQEKFAQGGLAQPSRKAVAEGPFFAQDTTSKPTNKKMLNEAVNYAVYSPFNEEWREIEEKLISPKLDLIFNGKKTAKEVFTALEPEINQSLKSLR